MTIKIIVAGSREFNNSNLLKNELHKFIKELEANKVEIVSGTAKGADKLGEQYAAHFNQDVKRFPANWDKYGRSAGYIRNSEMAKYADACIVFWDGKSKGTKHMIDLAEKEGLILKVVVYKSYYVNK